jgi:hypothetical protein
MHISECLRRREALGRGREGPQSGLAREVGVATDGGEPGSGDADASGLPPSRSEIYRIRPGLKAVRPLGRFTFGPLALAGSVDRGRTADGKFRQGRDVRKAS